MRVASTSPRKVWVPVNETAIFPTIEGLTPVTVNWTSLVAPGVLGPSPWASGIAPNEPVSALNVCADEAVAVHEHDDPDAVIPMEPVPPEEGKFCDDASRLKLHCSAAACVIVCGIPAIRTVAFLAVEPVFALTTIVTVSEPVTEEFDVTVTQLALLPVFQRQFEPDAVRLTLIEPPSFATFWLGEPSV